MDLTLTICAYNAVRWIEETLESVVGQTRQDFRLLIVDDCSTDATRQVVERFFERKPRQYELVSFEENRGIGYARHYAEQHATTRYMMFTDADDVLVPEAVERMYGAITADPDLMAVGCYLDYVDESGKAIGGGLYIGDTTKEAFVERAAKGKLIFMQPTAVYDRELALSVGGYVVDGYPEGKPRYQDFCEDLDLWTRMSDRYVDGKAIVVLPQVLCHYRKVGNGLSANTLNMMLKMRYTKANVRRRRAGLSDLTFVEFLGQFPEADMRKLRREAKGADALRSAAFNIKSRRQLRAIGDIAKSVWYNPGYIFDKIRHNILKKK